MNLGDYVRKVRKEKNLSLRETAKRCGISHPYLSQLENGKTNNPTAQVIEKLSKGLDLPYNMLLAMTGQTSIDASEEIVSVIVPKVDKTTGEQLKRGEAIRRTMDIFHMLDEDRITYYNGKQLTKDQKTKAIKVLNALFND